MNVEAVHHTVKLLTDREELDSALGNLKEGSAVWRALLEGRRTVQTKLQQQKRAVFCTLQFIRDLYHKMDDDNAGDGGPPLSSNIQGGARVMALMREAIAKVELPDHYESSSMPSTELDKSPVGAQIDHPVQTVSPTETASCRVSFPSVVQPITEAPAVGALVPNPVLNVPDVKPPRSEFDDFREVPQDPVLEPRTSKAAPKPRKAQENAPATTGLPTRAAAEAKPKKGGGGATKTIAKQPRKPATARQPRDRQLKAANGSVSSDAGASDDQKLTKISFAEFDRHCRKIASQRNGNRYACELCKTQIAANGRKDAYRHLMQHCDDPSACEENFDFLVDSD